MSSEELEYSTTPFSVFTYEAATSSASAKSAASREPSAATTASIVTAETTALDDLDRLADSIVSHYGPTTSPSGPLPAHLPISLPPLPPSSSPRSSPAVVLASDYARVCEANAHLSATARGLQQMNAELAIYAQRLLVQLSAFTDSPPAPPLPLLEAAAAGSASVAAAVGHTSSSSCSASAGAGSVAAHTDSSATPAFHSDAASGDGPSKEMPFIPAAFIPFLSAPPGAALDSSCGVCAEIKALTSTLPRPATSSKGKAKSKSKEEGAEGVDGGDRETPESDEEPEADEPATRSAVAAAAARAARSWAAATAAAEAARTQAVKEAANEIEGKPRTKGGHSRTASTASSPGTATKEAEDEDDEDVEFAAAAAVAAASAVAVAEHKDEPPRSAFSRSSVRVALWAVLMSAVAADMLLRQRALKLNLFLT